MPKKTIIKAFSDVSLNYGWWSMDKFILTPYSSVQCSEIVKFDLLSMMEKSCNHAKENNRENKEC